MILATLMLLGTATLPVVAEQAEPPALELATPFTDNMILQRQSEVPVWGWADPGSEVTVAFAGQEKTATAISGSSQTSKAKGSRT